VAEQRDEHVQEEDEKSYLPLLGAVTPMLLMIAVFMAAATTHALPTWALGLATAGMGILFIALAKLLGEGLVHNVNEWRRARKIRPIEDEDDPPAAAGQTLGEMFKKGHRRSGWLLFPAVGMLFAAPLLILAGLAIAAADAVT
jgi:hypothetical protein